MKSVGRHRARVNRGFTLLELVVVMGVLVALAAVLVPMLPEFVGKANRSAAAANMAELEKAIMTFRTTFSRNPNHWDSLLTEGGAAVSGLVPAAGNLGTGGGTLELRTLTSGQRARLSREGITMVYDIEDAIREGDEEFHATMNPYVTTQSYGAGRTIATGGGMLFLKRQDDGTYDDQVYNRSVFPGVILNVEHDYVVLGIGKYCNLTGPDGLVREAPVFGQHKQQSTPADAYQRFVAVYDVGKPDEYAHLYNARFVGVAAIVGRRLFTAGDIVGDYSDSRFEISEPPE
jgi:prepilin-type N-terminal cleavage/methylation domain-containing protein